MKQIIKIFQIDSVDKFINLSEIKNHKIEDFGNGFFISKEGYLASVAHVLTDNGLNSYALHNGRLQKIDIIERILTEKNENHIDVAIGKLDLDYRTNYFNPLKFEKVEMEKSLKVIGYLRINKNDLLINNYDNTFNFDFKELHTFCIDLKYSYSNESIQMHNSFTFFLNQTLFGGMSGCPVINESNNVVGIFKGGSLIGNYTKCQAIHIQVISEMYEKITTKNNNSL